MLSIPYPKCPATEVRDTSGGVGTFGGTRSSQSACWTWRAAGRTAARKAPAGRKALTGFSHCLPTRFLEPGQRALPGRLGARLVVAAPFIAMEAVSGVCVDMNVAIRPLLRDGLHVG